ncbi:hypothetical protein K1719_006172 [Acacia pycnantha]|nr:hypothetical protein K1719_006172 [Acacia pycnantha]
MFTLVFMLLFPLSVAILIMADDQIKCTSCSSCQNTCHQLPSPPPPPPPDPTDSCPPSLSPPSTSIYVYSSPPRGSGSTGAVFNPPPFHMNYPAPPPPNPIVPYFPFYFYSPPPPSPSTASTTSSSINAFCLFTFLVMLLI